MPTWWLNSISELEQHLLPCPFKLLTGCDCPACGTQRSFIHLLRGEVDLSWHANPLGIGLTTMILVFLATSKWSSLNWSVTRKITAELLLFAVLLNWCVKFQQGTCCN